MTVSSVALNTLVLAAKSARRVEEETLTEDKTIQGNQFKAGTTIHYLNNGRLNYAELSEDTTLQGVPYKAETSVWFRKNGKAFDGILAKDCKVKGKKLPGGSHIYFEPAGRLWRIELGGNMTIELRGKTKIEGYILPPKTIIELDQFERPYCVTRPDGSRLGFDAQGEMQPYCN